MTLGRHGAFTALLIVLAALAAATVTGLAAQSEAGAQVAGEKRSVWTGVYSDAQARRGRDVYEYSCAACHLPGLDGDSARDVPALYGDGFVTAWNKRTVKELFDLLRKTMPADTPGSLRAQSYADIVAYLLQSNEFPAGAGELPADGAVLGQLRIDRFPPAKP